MPTVSDICTRALKKLRVYGAGEELSAEDLADTLDDFNAMLFAWRIEGIDIAHVEVDESDTLDVPDDHIQTIVLAIAEQRSGSHGASLSPADQLTLQGGMNALRAYYWNLADLASDNPLSRWNVARTG